MLNAFVEIGYKVDWEVLKALDYDVSQKKEKELLLWV